MNDSGTVGLKVCGMRDPDNILRVALLKPDYMGFIFYQDSPRFVGDEFRIPSSFPGNIHKVGVFVNETSDRILGLTQLHALDFIQLHGDEPVAQCEELSGEGINLIKAFGVGNDFDFERLEPYKPFVRYFLFDSPGRAFGGNGVTFDWRALDKYNGAVPFFLSGGVSPQNVAGLARYRPLNLHAVDVNSRVELSPGLKDVEMVRNMKKEMRNL